jgi:hypothetical protein
VGGRKDEEGESGEDAGALDRPPAPPPDES